MNMNIRKEFYMKSSALLLMVLFLAVFPGLPRESYVFAYQDTRLEGNVGIGTTAPVDGKRLKVQGAAEVTGNFTLGGAFSPASISAHTVTGNLTVNGYIYVGSAATGTNSGEGRIFRGADRVAGFITNQIGTSDSASWEVVDYGWSEVLMSVNGGGQVGMRHGVYMAYGATGDSVGIGTTAPSANLQIANTGVVELRLSPGTPGAGQSNATFRMTGQDDATSEGFTAIYANSAGDTYFNNIYTASTNAFHFQKGAFGSGTELITIQNSGNVGIGTTVPTARLHVEGGLVTDYVASTIGNMSAGLFCGGDQAVTARFGIGVQGGFFYQGSSDVSNQNFDFRAPTAGGTLGVVNVRIRPTGNVGIGTEAPVNALQIGWNTEYAGNEFVVADGTGHMAIDIDGTSHNTVLYTNRNFALMASGSGSTGNVGIGTAGPNHKLEINGGNMLLGTSGYPALYVRDTGWWLGLLSSGESSWSDDDSFVFNTVGTGNRPFVFQKGGTGRTEGTVLMLIRGDSGNVGIGTTNPGSYKLYVNGDQYVGAMTTAVIPNLGPDSNNPEKGRWNPIWSAISAGKSLYDDEEFASGTNSVSVYNNAGGDGVVITRVADAGAPNTSGYVLQITNNGNATNPGYGGFIQTINSRRNTTFVQRFRAKLDAGRYLNINENPQGNNSTSYWLTSTAGTGKWEEYVRVSHCGNGGTFSGGGHVSVSGGSSIFTWYLASCNVYEVEYPIAKQFPKVDGTNATGIWPIGISGSAATATNAYGLLASSDKQHYLGESNNWDGVGFGNLTNLHFQGHDQFWVGAGNSTWYTGTGTAYNHDLLITTMQSDATYTRGITFAVDGTGAGNSGWRLGRWISGTSSATSKLVVDGNVGIGVTNPDSLLHIKKTGANAKMTIETDDTHTAYINFSGASNEASFGLDRTDLYWKFATGDDLSNPVVVINKNNGNVGIGTTAPQKILEVITPSNGFASFSNQIGVGAWTGIHFGYREPNQSYRKSALVFERTDHASFGNNASGKIHFLLDNVSSNSADSLADSVFTINEFGNVGVGTTGPNYRLQVSGGAGDIGGTYGHVIQSRDEYLRINNDDTGDYHTSGIYLDGPGTSSQQRMAIGSAGDYSLAPDKGLWVYGGSYLAATTGNVGVGTTAPIEKLMVNGAIASYGASLGYASMVNTAMLDFYGGATRVLAFGPSATRGKIQFYQAGANNANSLTAMAIDTNGYVGIGTTNPQNKLDVKGTILADPGNNVLSSSAALFAVAPGGTSNDVAILGYSVPIGQLFKVAGDGTSFFYGSVGIGSASPTAKLDVNGWVKSKTGYLDKNMMDSTVWTIGPGSVGGFGQNGSSSENERIWGTDPFGKPAMLWKSVNDAGNDGDGGWDYSSIPIDNFKAYRLAIWIKKDNVSSGSVYFGCSGSNTLNLADTVNDNPYFFSFGSSSLTANKWYLFVGYIHANDDSSTTSYSGVYDGVTGKKVISGTDFKNRNVASTQTHRTYNYYDTTTGSIQYFWGPRFEEINGSEPPIEALLGMPIGATQDANVYFGGNVGIGTAVPIKKLDVRGHIAADVLNSYNSGDPLELQYAIAGNVIVHGSDSDLIVEGTGNSSFAGSVGIGTTGPGQKLDVRGLATFLGSRIAVGDGSTVPYINAGTPGLWVSSGGASATSAFFGQSDTTHAGIWNQNWGVIVDNNGDVGIGTDNPTARLVAFSDTSSDGLFVDILSNPRITIRDRGNSDTILGVSGGAGQDNFFISTWNAVNALTITGSTGNVGIGTATPQAKLDVKSGGAAQALAGIAVRGAAGGTSNSIEWGHANGAGYGSTIGYYYSGGNPYIAFNGEAGTTANTFKTRGIRASIIIPDLAGGMQFGNVATASADNQSFTPLVTILNNGYVGIGTAGPVTNFHVVKPTYSDSLAVARFDNGNQTAYQAGYDTALIVQPDVACLRLIETNGGTQAAQQELSMAVGDGDAVIRSSSTATNGLSIMVNASPGNPGYNEGLGTLGLKIANSGDVGIQTTDLRGRLTIKGSSGGPSNTLWLTTNTYSQGSSGSTLILGHGAASGSTYGIINNMIAGQTAYGNLVLQSGGGNVGIGATGPAEKLEVAGGSVSIGNDYAYKSKSSGGTAVSLIFAGGDDYLYVGTAATFNGIRFRPGAATTVTMLAGGNVGIGTTAPVSKLEVMPVISSAALKSAVAIVNDDANVSSQGYPYINGGSALTWRTYAYVNDGQDYTRVSGKVGVVTESGSLGGTPLYTTYSAGMAFYTRPSSTAEDPTVERMRIKADGNVGIGTADPTFKLYATGDIYAGGVLRSSGGLNAGYGSTAPPSSGAIIAGNVGIGTNAPSLANVDINGTLRVRNTTSVGGTAWLAVDNNGVLTKNYSSIRFKENVTDYESVLSGIRQLKPVHFTWKANTSSPGMKDFGFIAEDVFKALPELVTFEDDGKTVMGLKYEKFSVLLIKAMQEQQTEIDGLRAENEELKKEIGEIRRSMQK